MSPRIFWLAASLAIAAGSVGTTLSATEIASARLVFEKSVKMKKIDASLYLSFLDQSVAGDGPFDPRQLLCGVMARGKSGPLSAAGSLRLRLLGEAEDGGGLWQSEAVEVAVDANGDATFGAVRIAELVASAAVAAAEVELARVDFDGGRGGRVTELVLDCLHERIGV